MKTFIPEHLIILSLSNAITGIMVGVIVGAFTTWFGFRRFRRERWWEIKHDAYKSIVETQYKLQTYLEKLYKEIKQANLARRAIRLNLFPSSKEFAETDDALTEFKKFFDIGAFSVGKEAQEKLKVVSGNMIKYYNRMLFEVERITRLNEPNEIPGEKIIQLWEKGLNEAQECTNKIIKIAREDLGEFLQ